MILPPIDHMTWISKFVLEEQIIAAGFPGPHTVPIEPAPREMRVSLAVEGDFQLQITEQGQTRPLLMVQILDKGFLRITPQILFNRVPPLAVTPAGFVLSLSKVITLEVSGLSLSTVNYASGVLSTLGASWVDDGTAIVASVAPIPGGSRITIQCDIAIRSTGTGTTQGAQRRIIDFPLPT